MIRWKYVIPRLVILATICLAVYLGTNPLIRWTLISSGQSATGAKVDIGSVKTSLSEGRVEIAGIQIADPDRPERNLIEAERAVFKMSIDGLLHKKLIVDKGSLEGVQFGTERTTSGALPDSETDPSEESIVAKKAKELLDPWLDDVRDRLAETAYEQSETAQVADELLERWPREYDVVRADAESLKRRVLELRRRIDVASENPLRNISSYQQSMEELPTLSQDIDRLYRRLDELARQVPVDRQAILEAKDRDKEKLLKIARVRKVDGDQISEIALGEENGERLNQITEWIQWARATVPNPEKDFVPRRMRGVDVHFGENRSPDLLVRELSITGSGELDGDPYDLSGTISDLTTQPRLHGKPTVVRLKAEGDRTFLLTAELDRTSKVAQDRFRLISPEVKHGYRQVGNDSTMQFAFDGGSMTLECNMVLVGDQVRGEIRSIHRNVQVSVENVGADLGGDGVRQMLTSSLHGIDTFDVVLHLSGSIDDPDVKVESDLGPRVADQFQMAFSSELDRRIEKSLGDLDQIAYEKIQSLESSIQEQHGLVLGDLQFGTNELARLRNVVADRLSFGRIR